LLAGPLGVITFDGLALGLETLSIAGVTVSAEDFTEIGSCNPTAETAMPCAGGKVLVLACPATEPNSDKEVRPNGAALEEDDGTWPNHDNHGDLCDNDDDNDGLSDSEELTGSACGNTVTIPIDADSDDDHLLDGWECNPNGLPPSNPLDAASRQMGVGTGDADGDLIPDLWERRGYNTRSGPDTDGDGCSEMVEVASVDGNRAVTDADRLAVARRSFNISPFDVGVYEQDFVLDIDHNGVVDDKDRLFVARAALLPAPWVPKICP
jgi:hypothetical protein